MRERLEGVFQLQHRASLALKTRTSMTPVLCTLALLAGGATAFTVAPTAKLHNLGQPQWRPHRAEAPRPHLHAGSALSMVTSPTRPQLGTPPVASSKSKASTSNLHEGKSDRLLNVQSDSKSWRSLPEMWQYLSAQCGDSTALVDPLHAGVTETLTFSDVRSRVDQMAGALQRLGVCRGDCVSIFAENSNRWLITEQGVMRAGACNAVRGAAAPVDELKYIYSNSQSMGLVVEKANLLQSLLDSNGTVQAEQGPPRFIMVMYAAGKSGEQIKTELGVDSSVNVVTYKECMDMGSPLQEVEIDPSMRATLLYTSGTTSKPKGVVLSHANLMNQVAENAFNRAGRRELDVWPGDTFVSVLPCWHIFERTAEYYTLSRGVKMVYSNVRNFKADLRKHKPHFLVAVPRLIEVIYKGVQTQMASKPPALQKVAAALTGVSALSMRARRVLTGMVIGTRRPPLLQRALAAVVVTLCWPLVRLADKLVWSKIRDGMGGRVKVVVSGGSALAPYLEDFFDMANTRVLVGYGLTETSPVLANRLTEHNVRGTVGLPMPGTTIKIAHPETGEQVAPGEDGVIWAKGAQIMSGYNRDPVATASVMDKDGFFNTGDLGRMNLLTGDLIVTGRAKDTIVLSNGENVEPQPIEDAVASRCKLVDQVMLVGQDQRYLSAIVALNPVELFNEGLISEEEKKCYCDLLGATPLSTGVVGSGDDMKAAMKELSSKPGLKDAVTEGVRKATKDFRPWEQVGDVIMTFEPFTIPNGLITQTLKIKRNVVVQTFRDEINRVYSP